MPIDRAAIERELEPGAGCSLDDGIPAGPLLVAVAGDAIVKINGRIVHVKPAANDLAELFKGGRFVAPGVTIEVQREGKVERVDEVTTWQATLHIRGGETGFTSFHHRWSCGA
jgi:membrane-associated protease RseP (regulator of RpoE activity)